MADRTNNFLHAFETTASPSRRISNGMKLERRFSRRQLFTIYSNRLYFGKGIIGVEEASHFFYQKEPNQLDIGEAALLAGLVRAPAYYSPMAHPERALVRRNEVLDRMAAAHAINNEDLSKFKSLLIPRMAN